jgi:membrane protein DedA with SNARE-associated domain
VPDWIVDLFARFGYWAVFLGVFLENAGLPVPGETTVLAGAVLAHEGRLSLTGVVLTAIGGAILGDNTGFFIGRRAGRGLLERFGRRIGVTRERLQGFDRFFDRHGGRTIFIARFVTGLRVVGALLAGASGLRWPTFLFYNAAGAVVWASAVAIAGYTLAESWDVLERWIGRSGLVALAAIAILLIVGWRRARGKESPS